MSKKTSIIRQSTLDHFGIKQPGTYVSPLHYSLISDIKDGINNYYMMAIVGQFGSGKSQIQLMLEADYLSENKSTRPLFVHIVSPAKSKLHIGAVVDAMIRMLEVPEAGRSVDAKTINLIPALGDMVKKKNRKVCLVIDNAHRCDKELFSEIRDLREQHFEGIRPLFSVLLIGQPGKKGLDGKLMLRKEVGLRTQILELTEREGWWDFDMRMKYLNSVYNGAISESAQINIACKTTVPLEIDSLVGECMEEAKKGRKKIVDEEVIPATDQEILSGLGISLHDIANRAGVGKTTVHRRLNGGKISDEKASMIDLALNELKAEKLAVAV